MKQQSCLLLLLLLFCHPIFLQAQVRTAWTRQFSGPGSSADRARVMAFGDKERLFVLGNGGFNIYQADGFQLNSFELYSNDALSSYYNAGKQLAFDKFDHLYITDELGLLKLVLGDEPLNWRLPYGGNVLLVDDSGNVYVGGQANGNFQTAKYNVAGNLLWVKEYDGPAHGQDSLTAMAFDSKGNVYACGKSTTAAGAVFTTVSYNANGTEQWARFYTGNAASAGTAYAIAVDSTDHVYVTGQCNRDIATIKYDASGQQLWVRTFNGPAKGDDGALAAALDDSANLFITGFSTGNGSGSDYVILKYDPQGNEHWVQRYNGTGNGKDIASLIAIDQVGNIIISGSSWGKESGEDYATIKYDPAGKQEWVNRFDHGGLGEGGAHDLVVDSQGAVYVTGAFTVKYNSAGQELWKDHYYKVGYRFDGANDLVTDDADNVYITGFSEQEVSNDFDFKTIRYNADGQEVWVASYNGPANGDDVAVALINDKQGNLYVTGWSGDQATGDDFTTIKYSSAGKELWVKKYNGPGNGEDKASGIAMDADGNVYVTGWSQGNGTGMDYATIKYSPEGKEIWVRRYDGVMQDDMPKTIAVNATGHIYVSGQGYVAGVPQQNGYCTLSYDAAGNERWVRGFGSEGGATSLALDDSGNVYVTGSCRVGTSNNDLVTLKYNASGKLVWKNQFHGPRNGYDRGNDIAVDGQQNVFVTGGVDSDYGYEFSAFITLKYSAAGQQLWAMPYQRTSIYGYFNEESKAIALDTSGNAYVTGPYEKGILSIKYDSSGHVVWQEFIPPSFSDDHGSTDVEVDKSGNVLVTGHVDTGESSVGGYDDIFTIKYEQVKVALVESIRWVNAESDIEGMGIRNGDTLNFANFSSPYINLRVHTNPAKVDSVVLVLSGKQQRTQIERLPPYALFGDNNGDYNKWLPLNGDYLLTATPYHNGAKGTPTTVRFHVLYQRVSSFVLVDAEADRDVRVLKQIDTIHLEDLSTNRLNIRVNTKPGIVGSVVFEGIGARHVENTAPYALGGNRGGDYLNWIPQAGNYILKATPYSGKNGYGSAGLPSYLDLYVTDSLTLGGFTLVDAASDTLIRNLNDGDVIDLAHTPVINIRAERGKGRIGSVRFGLNNTADYHVEQNAPYLLAANKGTDYFNWQVAPGKYAITATPYAARNALGKQGTPKSITITIINSLLQHPTDITGKNPLQTDKAFTLQVLPMPIINDGQLFCQTDKGGNTMIELRTIEGKKIQQIYTGKMEAGLTYRFPLQVSGLSKGIYLVVFRLEDGRQKTTKIIKQ